MQEQEALERTFESSETEIEFVGALEDVTYGWSSYTYDVSWGDRHD